MVLDWIRSYLSDRKQYVTYENIDSAPRNITVGVPQGSLLGPLLFIIYTNDLPNVIQNLSCILFADDTTIVISSINMRQHKLKIESDMTSLADWFLANKLSLNVQKKVVLFLSKHVGSNTEMLTIGHKTIEKLK